MAVSWSVDREAASHLGFDAASEWDREPGEGSSRLDEARTFLEIATRYREYRWPDKARRFARRALRIFEHELGPDDVNVAGALVCLGGIFRDRGELEAAEAHYLRATSILDRDSRNTSNLEAQRLRIQAARGFADVTCALGRYCEAESMLKHALAMADRTFGRQSVVAASVLNDLGVFHKYTGRFDKAAAVLEEALQIAEIAGGPDHLEVAAILHSLSILDLVRGRFWLCEPFARRSVAIREAILGPDHPQVASSVVTLAAILDGQGERAEAEAHYRRALTTFERWFGPEHYEVAMTLSCLAGLVRTQGRFSEAEPMYRRALTIFDRPIGALEPAASTQAIRCA
jgi:tetratricopeptide (TPR) repeat protein